MNVSSSGWHESGERRRMEERFDDTALDLFSLTRATCVGTIHTVRARLSVYVEEVSWQGKKQEGRRSDRTCPASYKYSIVSPASQPLPLITHHQLTMISYDTCISSRSLPQKLFTRTRSLISLREYRLFQHLFLSYLCTYSR